MSKRPSLLLLCLLSAGCVAYSKDDVDPASMAAEIHGRPGGHFSIDGAITLALRQNPELRVLAARQRAAEALRTVPIDAVGEVRGRSRAWGIMLDPIALLGLGPRGGAMDTASAKAQAAAAELATARWRTVTAVAEVFWIEGVLAAEQSDDLTIEGKKFEAAGLASPADAARLAAAQAEAHKERVDFARLRADNLTRFRRLLGLPRSAPVQLLPVEPNWFDPPPFTAASLIQRPDLRLAATEFEVADATFWKAVTEQYPAIQVGPNVSFAGDPLRAMAMVRIPIGAGAHARAARAQREAARSELAGKFLTAEEDAALADQRFEAARAALRAGTLSLRASRIELRAARVGVEVDPDAFAPFARAADRLMRAVHTHRQAAIEHARAVIARAHAYGWPLRDRSAGQATEAGS